MSDELPRFYRVATNVIIPFVSQPGPLNNDQIWTTDIYSYAPQGGGPGGGLYDYEIRIGGYGDEYRILIQFDLTNMPTNVASAKLMLYCYSTSGGGTASFLYQITQPWWNWQTSGTGPDHNRLWWADQPQATLWESNSLPAPLPNQWYTVDVTSLVSAWQSGAVSNCGLELRPVSENNTFNFFYSANYMDDPNLRPKLIITPAD